MRAAVLSEFPLSLMMSLTKVIKGARALLHVSTGILSSSLLESWGGKGSVYGKVHTDGHVHIWKCKVHTNTQIHKQTYTDTHNHTDTHHTSPLLCVSLRKKRWEGEGVIGVYTHYSKGRRWPLTQDADPWPKALTPDPRWATVGPVRAGHKILSWIEGLKMQLVRQV